MAFINDAVRRRRKEVVKIHQENGALSPMPPVVPAQLFRQPAVMEVQALVLLAGPVVIDHPRAIQRRQDVLGQGLVYLPVIDVRRVNGAGFSALGQGETDIFSRFPGLA
jgi:hypothetical protein